MMALMGPTAGPMTGPYIMFEGESLAVDASGSTDPDGSVVMFNWFIEKQVGEGTQQTLVAANAGPTPTLSWAQLVSAGANDGFNFFDPQGDYTLVVEVIDNDGLVDQDSTTLTIMNAAPTVVSAVASGGGTGGCGGGGGSEATLQIVVADPSPVDVLTVTVNWGDGTIIEYPVPVGQTTISPVHTYATTGEKSISVKVTDDDFAESATVLTAFTPGSSVEAGVVVENGVLYIAGSCGDDWVHVNAFSGGLRVHASFLPESSYHQDITAAVQQIVVQLHGGNDVFTIARSIALPLIVAGGDGDDLIVGTSGRTVLIGGDGSDTLLGGRGEDLLIGGSTTHDDNRAALLDILNEWASTRTIEERIQNLVDGTGTVVRENGSTFLVAGSTVIDDEDLDILVGGQDLDAVVAGELDVAIGSHRDLIGSDLDDLLV